jgi:hypothetical protein
MGAARLIDWLAGDYDASGTSRSAPGNIQFYYKLPAVFATAGRRSLGLRVLEQAIARFFKSGRFVLDDDPIAAPWIGYLGGWLAWGAAMLGRFDVARQTIDSVIHLQDRTYGGFVHSSGGVMVQDTERTSAAAMGCVWAMQLDHAQAAAGFLKYALKAQAAPDREFHTYIDLEGKLHPDVSDRNACFRSDDDQARPALFATTVAFLVWLGRATGREDLLDLAARYMGVVNANRHDPARLPLATKTGWAALLLARHRCAPAMNEFAYRCGAAILERQLSNGSISFDGVPDVPKPVAPVWLNGWGCDAALTLTAIADGE